MPEVPYVSIQASLEFFGTVLYLLQNQNFTGFDPLSRKSEILNRGQTMVKQWSNNGQTNGPDWSDQKILEFSEIN